MAICVLVLLGIVGRQHSQSLCYPRRPSSEYHTSRAKALRDDTNWAENTDDLKFHPFENKCKFAMPNTYASDITGYRVAERLRQLQCPYENYDFATMDSEGYMYVHPHFTRFPNVTSGVKCNVVFLEGGLRNKTTNKGKDDFEEVAAVEAPVNKRFFANGDVFYVRCNQNGKQIFQQVYAGIRDLERTSNQIYIVKDTESFDDYGRRRKSKKMQTPQRYSIDILGFDSTSRSMFMRHLPRTVETMNRLGYEFFYGYTKVGDNSAVNLVPILAGDVPAALNEPKLDASGDISNNWILPTNKKLDPTEIPFLWKMMQEMFGCRTMLNEDISMKALGLFHYPRKEFLPGFTSSPTDHFYRSYYLAVYKNWNYSQCKDGGQVQRQFTDLWRRFANKYKDICHFGFTFVTTLTHEAGFVLETLDEQISSNLENLYVTGALDSGISVIMGDHGNRIGLVQYSYTGRIEERMPLMAIRLPPNFRTMHPKEYSNFLINKWKLTSNFDIYQTLKDIALMSFGSTRKSVTENYGRGISLFDEIPVSRMCFDAFIPENFCTCLVNRTGLSMPKEAEYSRKKVSEKKYLKAIEDWIHSNELNDCLDRTSITTAGEAMVLGINSLVRHGLRSKQNTTIVEQMRKKDPSMDFLFHEVVVQMQIISNRRFVKLLFRLEEIVATSVFRVVFEPAVYNTFTECYGKSVFALCSCFSSYQ